jgi:hypothetical protein
MNLKPMFPDETFEDHCDTIDRNIDEVAGRLWGTVATSSSR